VTPACCCPHHSRRDFLVNASATTFAAGWASTLSAPSFAAESPQALKGQPARLQSFDMADVRLAEGPFLHAQRLTGTYLIRRQPDRMLHNFRVNAGLAPKAPVYGGRESEATWEDINCHGHTLGHYLSA
jgi:uncharacterized protein